MKHVNFVFLDSKQHAITAHYQLPDLLRKALIFWCIGKPLGIKLS